MDWPKMEAPPEPEGDLRDTSRIPSEEYASCALRLLMNEFPRLPLKVLRRRFEEKRKHYLPTLEALREQYDEEVAAYEACSDTETYTPLRFRLLTEPREFMEVDIDFVPSRDLLENELAFLREERELERREKAVAKEREKKRQEAVEKGDAVECGCCFEEEAADLMTCCGSGHSFCYDCALNAAKMVMERSKTRLACLESGCEDVFAENEAKKFMDRKQFKLWERRVQQAELAAAGIIDLEECPFCDFGMVIDDDELLVFICQNPGCMKQSCRKCKGISHLPLRCEEVEDATTVKRRNFMHEKMTEALVRTCPACKKNFFKEEGCNKMTCPCGQSMCYVCRKPIESYAHFSDDGCPLMVDTKRLHEDELEAAKEVAEDIIAVEVDSIPMPKDAAPATDSETAVEGDQEAGPAIEEEPHVPDRRRS
eukprot:CAMPEP_0114626616 /NCGR_PEP_ID=MMETSP0168-20121206/11875_1 /TAXON_ID=95228 ORGANISM="Vannella sp., Strain DIVA3 517/6/12" /NCGR_SAMPLE_ID=MMETSP0168 /ASSEMBLY_ACC=CAM_ASM_000044 /LENGTH=424 /DNA_ID=CAMNT_0001837929 /DNA_START=34 /DNA_END=1305 /DNA_ORIENTATION=+